MSTDLIGKDEKQTFRIDGITWKLPKVISFEGLWKLYTYEVEDYRPPMAGEFYISGAIPRAYKAYYDMNDKFLVVTPKNKIEPIQAYIEVPQGD